MRQIFPFIVFFIIAFLSIGIYNNYLNTILADFEVHINLKRSKGGSIQLFYSKNSAFSESHSVVKEMNKSQNFQSVRFIDLQKQDYINRLRIDFNFPNSQDTILLHSIALHSSGYEKVWRGQELIKILDYYSKGIINFQSTEEGIYLIINNYDPYVVLLPLKGIAFDKIMLIILLLCSLGITAGIIFASSNSLKSASKKLNTSIFKSDNLVVIGCGIIIVTLPLPRIWSSYATIFLFVVCFLSFFSSKKKFNQIPFFWIFIIIYMIRPISLIYSPDIDKGISYLERQLSFLIFPLLFSLIFIKKENHDNVIMIFFYSMFTYCCFSICSLFYNLLIYDIDIVTYFNNLKPWSVFLFSWTTFRHASYITIFMIFGSLCGIYLLNQGKIKKNFLAFNIVSLLVILILSGARISLLIFVVLLIVFLLNLILNKRAIVFIFIAGFISAIIFIYLFPDILHIIDPSRYQMWKIALEMIKENPVIGYGAGANSEILRSNEIAKMFGFAEGLSYNNPHNQYLNDVLSFGLLGGGVLFLLLMLITIKSVKFQDFLLTCFIIMQLFFMMTEVSLHTIKGIVFFTFTASFLLATIRYRKNSF